MVYLECVEAFDLSHLALWQFNLTNRNICNVRFLPRWVYFFNVSLGTKHKIRAPRPNHEAKFVYISRLSDSSTRQVTSRFTGTPTTPTPIVGPCRTRSQSQATPTSNWAAANRWVEVPRRPSGSKALQTARAAES